MILAQYINGNTKVTIHDDGTKVREYEGIPKPIHPESCDVKISNRCDGKCHFCSEMSNPQGKHADLNKLLEVLDPLPAGVELAFGFNTGHPDLITFLQSVKQKGWIANTTINERHIHNNIELIQFLIKNDLVKGIGISYSSNDYISEIKSLLSMTNNIVFHLIMGINTLQDIDCLYEVCQDQGKDCKILVLGYKNYGNGSNYLLEHKEEIENNKYLWYTRLVSLFSLIGMTFSFDNLAIDQLNLKRYFTNKAWDKFYMGGDGKWTCYIDAVKQEFAVSSTSTNRVSFNNVDLLSYFGNISEISTNKIAK